MINLLEQQAAESKSLHSFESTINRFKKLFRSLKSKTDGLGKVTVGKKSESYTQLRILAEEFNNSMNSYQNSMNVIIFLENFLSFGDFLFFELQEPFLACNLVYSAVTDIVKRIEERLNAFGSSAKKTVEMALDRDNRALTIESLLELDVASASNMSINNTLNNSIHYLMIKGELGVHLCTLDFLVRFPECYSHEQTLVKRLEILDTIIEILKTEEFNEDHTNSTWNLVFSSCIETFDIICTSTERDNAVPILIKYLEFAEANSSLFENFNQLKFNLILRISQCIITSKNHDLCQFGCKFIKDIIDWTKTCDNLSSERKSTWTTFYQKLQIAFTFKCQDFKSVTEKEYIKCKQSLYKGFENDKKRRSKKKLYVDVNAQDPQMDSCIQDSYKICIGYRALLDHLFDENSVEKFSAVVVILEALNRSNIKGLNTIEKHYGDYKDIEMECFSLLQVGWDLLFTDLGVENYLNLSEGYASIGITSPNLSLHINVPSFELHSFLDHLFYFEEFYQAYELGKKIPDPDLHTQVKNLVCEIRREQEELTMSQSLLLDKCKMTVMAVPLSTRNSCYVAMLSLFSKNQDYFRESCTEEIKDAIKLLWDVALTVGISLRNGKRVSFATDMTIKITDPSSFLLADISISQNLSPHYIHKVISQILKSIDSHRQLEDILSLAAKMIDYLTIQIHEALTKNSKAKANQIHEFNFILGRYYSLYHEMLIIQAKGKVNATSLSSELYDPSCDSISLSDSSSPVSALYKSLTAEYAQNPILHAICILNFGQTVRMNTKQHVQKIINSAITTMSHHKAIYKDFNYVKRAYKCARIDLSENFWEEIGLIETPCFYMLHCKPSSEGMITGRDNNYYGTGLYYSSNLLHQIISGLASNVQYTIGLTVYNSSRQKIRQDIVVLGENLLIGWAPTTLVCWKLISDFSYKFEDIISVERSFMAFHDALIIEEISFLELLTEKSFETMFKWGSPISKISNGVLEEFVITALRWCRLVISSDIHDVRLSIRLILNLRQCLDICKEMDWNNAKMEITLRFCQLIYSIDQVLKTPNEFLIKTAIEVLSEISDAIVQDDLLRHTAKEEFSLIAFVVYWVCEKISEMGNKTVLRNFIKSCLNIVDILFSSNKPKPFRSDSLNELLDYTTRKTLTQVEKSRRMQYEEEAFHAIKATSDKFQSDENQISKIEMLKERLQILALHIDDSDQIGNDPFLSSVQNLYCVFSKTGCTNAFEKLCQIKVHPRFVELSCRLAEEAFAQNDMELCLKIGKMVNNWITVRNNGIMNPQAIASVEDNGKSFKRSSFYNRKKRRNASKRQKERLERRLKGKSTSSGNVPKSVSPNSEDRFLADIGDEEKEVSNVRASLRNSNFSRSRTPSPTKELKSKGIENAKKSIRKILPDLWTRKRLKKRLYELTINEQLARSSLNLRLSLALCQVLINEKQLIFDLKKIKKESNCISLFQKSYIVKHCFYETQQTHFNLELEQKDDPLYQTMESIHDLMMLLNQSFVLAFRSRSFIQARNVIFQILNVHNQLVWASIPFVLSDNLFRVTTDLLLDAVNEGLITVEETFSHPNSIERDLFCSFMAHAIVYLQLEKKSNYLNSFVARIDFLEPKITAKLSSSSNILCVANQDLQVLKKLDSKLNYIEFPLPTYESRFAITETDEMIIQLRNWLESSRDQHNNFDLSTGWFLLGNMFYELKNNVRKAIICWNQSIDVGFSTREVLQQWQSISAAKQISSSYSWTHLIVAITKIAKVAYATDNFKRSSLLCFAADLALTILCESPFYCNLKPKDFAQTVDVGLIVSAQISHPDLFDSFKIICKELFMQKDYSSILPLCSWMLYLSKLDILRRAVSLSYRIICLAKLGFKKSVFSAIKDLLNIEKVSHKELGFAAIVEENIDLKFDFLKITILSLADLKKVSDFSNITAQLKLMKLKIALFGLSRNENWIEIDSKRIFQFIREIVELPISGKDSSDILLLLSKLLSKIEHNLDATLVSLYSLRKFKCQNTHFGNIVHFICRIAAKSQQNHWFDHFILQLSGMDMCAITRIKLESCRLHLNNQDIEKIESLEKNISSWNQCTRSLRFQSGPEGFRSQFLAKSYIKCVFALNHFVPLELVFCKFRAEEMKAKDEEMIRILKISTSESVDVNNLRYLPYDYLYKIIDAAESKDTILTIHNETFVGYLCFPVDIVMFSLKKLLSIEEDPNICSNIIHTLHKRIDDTKKSSILSNVKHVPEPLRRLFFQHLDLKNLIENTKFCSAEDFPNVDDTVQFNINFVQLVSSLNSMKLSCNSSFSMVQLNQLDRKITQAVPSLAEITCEPLMKIIENNGIPKSNKNWIGMSWLKDERQNSRKYVFVYVWTNEAAVTNTCVVKFSVDSAKVSYLESYLKKKKDPNLSRVFSYLRHLLKNLQAKIIGSDTNFKEKFRAVPAGDPPNVLKSHIELVLSNDLLLSYEPLEISFMEWILCEACRKEE